jgi:hypothetical protein
MKNLIIATTYLIGCLFVFSCDSPAAIKKTDITKSSVDTAIKGQDTIIADNEYISWDEARINGTVAMISTSKILYASLGKPDSIITPNMDDVCVSYFDKNYKDVYIKGSTFEMCGDTVAIRSLNFRQPGLTFTAGQLRFDNNTTMTSLAKTFPTAIKEQSNMTLAHNEAVTAIKVQTGKMPSDDSWILMFKNGKLVQIDYWMPC